MYAPKIAINLNIKEKQTVSLISRTKAQRTRVQTQTHRLSCQTVCCSGVSSSFLYLRNPALLWNGNISF